MANLRDVRLRMRAIEQTLQVTKAMNLISTAKLRKGRRVLADTEPFFKRIQKSMWDILSGAENVESEFFGRKQKDRPRTAILAVTSDKGLAGGYNADIFRTVNDLAAAQDNPVLILIGAIGGRYFAHTPYRVLENFSLRSRLPEVEDAKEIADYLISHYLWGMLDEVYIVYTHMYSAVRLLPTVRQILPLRAEEIQAELERTGNQKREELPFEYLPSEAAVFDALVPLYIKGIIYGSLVESYASEQNARMSAMDEASKNAEDMLAGLRLHYNRTRQAGITLEVSEIISGAEALEE
ncbi:MAG: ATP synthase F1 subunit gamma [Spirochaetaceae bacterium]|jgi:F-type H+-transporting ATPase subunit gamma|nr:ATP synthase F1 subunit gamma [Spirochaetaceae bacterium]